jgi:hypothetical protein
MASTAAMARARRMLVKDSSNESSDTDVKMAIGLPFEVKIISFSLPNRRQT